MIEGDDAAVIGCVLVRADAEDPAERSGERRQEPAGDTGPWRSPGQRRARAVLAGVPPHRRGVPADRRQDARPAAERRRRRRRPQPRLRAVAARPSDSASSAPSSHWALSSQSSTPSSPSSMLTGTSRSSSLGGGHEVTDAEIARTHPLAPRHPVGRQQRLGPRQQHDLVHRDRLGARGPGDRDGPAPAHVGRIQAARTGGSRPARRPRRRRHARRRCRRRRAPQRRRGPGRSPRRRPRRGRRHVHE